MKLKIGHATVTVSPLTQEESDEQDCWGQYNVKTHKIGVSAFVPPEEQARILIHECLHAIWWVWNVPSKPSEEQVVERLDRGLASLFRDNPELLAHLHQALNNGKPIVT